MSVATSRQLVDRRQLAKGLVNHRARSQYKLFWVKTLNAEGRKHFFVYFAIRHKWMASTR